MLTKIGWATFWANFTQTHLVTLFGDHPHAQRHWKMLQICMCIVFYLFLQH
jgi:hypothetical protein